MRRSNSLFVFVAFCCFSHVAHAKTRLAVSAFEDKSGSQSSCNKGFLRELMGDKLGSGFKDQLVTELAKTGRFQIVERDNLRKMYSDEHELINADRATKPKKNKFKAAEFSIVGAVTSFELCQSNVGGDLDVGSLITGGKKSFDVGAERSSASVVLDVRVVGVTTGVVIDSFRAEGAATSTDFKLSGSIKGAKFGSKGFYKTPLGEATREALKDATGKIVNSLRNRRSIAH